MAGRYLSFYRYARCGPGEAARAGQLAQLRRALVEEWSELGVRGRVYISGGVNGQVCVPEPSEEAFTQALRQRKELVGDAGELILSRGERVGAGEPQPFSDLRVKVRQRLVNDGLPESLDLSDRGQLVAPAQWHELLQKRDEDVVVLDCRNGYEFDVGRFEEARKVQVDVYRDTWEELGRLLEGRPKDKTNVMIYCTGGIRCEKAGAFLRQEMGFDHVLRLRGGIVNYLEFVKESGVASQFVGRNFVFDERATQGGVQATEDVLGRCAYCSAPHDVHSRCSSPVCSNLMLQCPACAAQMGGACSPLCQTTAQAAQALETEEERRAFRRAAAAQLKSNSPGPSERYGILRGETGRLQRDGGPDRGFETRTGQSSIRTFATLTGGPRSMAIGAGQARVHVCRGKLERVAGSPAQHLRSSRSLVTDHGDPSTGEHEACPLDHELAEYIAASSTRLNCHNALQALRAETLSSIPRAHMLASPQQGAFLRK